MTQEDTYITWPEYTTIEKYFQQQLLISGFKLGEWKTQTEGIGNYMNATKSDTYYRFIISLKTNKCVGFTIEKGTETLINTIIKVNTDIFKTIKEIIQEVAA